MTDRSTLRLVVLQVLVLSLLLTLVGRLWYMQVIAGPDVRGALLGQRDAVAWSPRPCAA